MHLSAKVFGIRDRLLWVHKILLELFPIAVKEVVKDSFIVVCFMWVYLRF